MALHNFKMTLAVAATIAVTATVSTAATFGLVPINGTATTLPASTYSLIEPVLPFPIISFRDEGSLFGGLFLSGTTANTRLTYTFIGSEASATNLSTLALGSNSFSNATSVNGDNFTTQQTFDDFVDLNFETNNLSESDFISNLFGSASDSRLSIAFSDISNDPFATSVYAFFGDGAGDNDFDDLVLRIDTFEVSEVPLPAGGILLISALGGLAAARRARRKS
ncbi:hypothetical protein C1J03_08395 [Sulfitobacter sp. SK012]|uniref:VPLPA-CTERM sorting domain-containing protein n=1 Tax=Sulfitobacter sp. SK012 TaxID=1389005 RepID=UPI000E10B119|nr:VPLPA-CTERM sorting domain-containing protein [Sulfitobacter sp. SK012]AXI46033.1 hypothetical protein C1J03_08395 [Sulfitobacter sp. SK012]